MQWFHGVGPEGGRGHGLLFITVLHTPEQSILQQHQPASWNLCTWFTRSRQVSQTSHWFWWFLNEGHSRSVAAALSLQSQSHNVWRDVLQMCSGPASDGQRKSPHPLHRCQWQKHVDRENTGDHEGERLRLVIISAADISANLDGVQSLSRASVFWHVYVSRKKNDSPADRTFVLLMSHVLFHVSELFLDGEKKRSNTGLITRLNVEMIWLGNTSPLSPSLSCFRLLICQWNVKVSPQVRPTAVNSSHCCDNA